MHSPAHFSPAELAERIVQEADATMRGTTLTPELVMSELTRGQGRRVSRDTLSDIHPRHADRLSDIVYIRRLADAGNYDALVGFLPFDAELEERIGDARDALAARLSAMPC